MKNTCFFYVGVYLIATDFRRFRGRKTHTFWYQQTVHPDLVLRCCVHAPDALQCLDQGRKTIMNLIQAWFTISLH